MLQVSRVIQFQPRDDKNAYRSLGIIWIPGRKVVEATRGISYDHPGGYFAQTWLGNIQMAPGDWLITSPAGNRYVVKQGDWQPDTPTNQPSWPTPLKFFQKRIWFSKR